MSDYEITLINDSMQEFYVRFHGPQESEYFTASCLIQDEIKSAASIHAR